MRALTEEDKQTIHKLDIIQRHLENEICFAALEGEDLYHEEKDIFIRGFIFSQGTREEAVVIGDDGFIHFHCHLTEKSIRPNLIKSVCRCLLDYLLFSEGTENND